jgi:hypothetical protein
MKDDESRAFLMISETVTANTEATILARLLQSRENMNRDVAEYLLSIDFEAGDIDRMNLLSERAREGTLTREETTELDSYLHVGSLLAILQSRARRILKSEGAVPRSS